MCAGEKIFFRQDRVRGNDAAALPEVMFLDAWKLKLPAFPMEPSILVPWYAPPCPWAASSSTKRWCFAANARIASMSAG